MIDFSRRNLYIMLLQLRCSLPVWRRIDYIGGSEVLPPPLPSDEERRLLERLSQHDFEARQQLIEHNLRLVVYIARKFENTGVNIEDLISIGAIGLIKAVNTFDVSKKIKLATYASRCIENEILMYLRRNNKTRSEISFDEPLNIDWDGNELLLSDILGTDDDIIYKEIEEELEKRLSGRGSEDEVQLNERMRRVRYELDQAPLYDYVVVNDDLQRAKREIQDIIRKEKEKTI